MDKILVFDFGSQYTQLIARRIRELHVYCEILPYNYNGPIDKDTKAIILSGSPCSVKGESVLNFNLDRVLGKYPILGICYGAQYLCNALGGDVRSANKREYGRAMLDEVDGNSHLLENVKDKEVWMSHADTILKLPDSFEVISNTSTIPVAGFQSKKGEYDYPVFGIQFHPEVTHTKEGTTILNNFVVNIANCSPDWTPQSYVESSVESLKEQLGDDRVMLGLSGGVDSSVAAMLLNLAIGDKLVCYFIDNGLLRKNEYQEVLDSYKSLGLNVKGIDAKRQFWDTLKGITDPETKRKKIGNLFIEIFEYHAKAEGDIKWLAQGTIYPDVIESVSVHGPSVTIKSHHNVGGLPEKLNIKIVEPLRSCFKDEVRKIGEAVDLPKHILNRHPFPGPGLAIRILGDITKEKVEMLQEVDDIFISGLKKSGLYDQIWQAGAILLPVKSVGVMGDERTYEKTVALRAVESIDGMTADWARLPYDFLAEVSNDIINQVKGVNRVVYDISSKPPSTIEWE